MRGHYLAHNSIIWSPHAKQEYVRIEQVQRRVTKRLKGYNSFSYDQRLYSC